MTAALAHSRPPSFDPPRLGHAELAATHTETLAAPRRDYSIAARLLFAGLDVFYGKARILEKFPVLELIARVPYQAWEQAAYVAITHVHDRTDLARRIHDRVAEARSQQDNEQWHLLILDEMIAADGPTLGAIRSFWLPQLIAFTYYQIAWLLFVIRPDWSYRINADFEDHAEHEYALLVGEHPEWETHPFESAFSADYGSFQSRADALRQMSHDERFHKLESAARIDAARFQ